MQSYLAVGLFVHTHTLIMNFLFESNKAVPLVPTHMSLLEFCIFKVPLLTRFPIFTRVMI